MESESGQKQGPSEDQPVIQTIGGTWVTYVKASERPELLFDEVAEGETLAKVKALQGARRRFLEDGNQMVGG